MPACPDPAPPFPLPDLAVLIMERREAAERGWAATLGALPPVSGPQAGAEAPHSSSPMAPPQSPASGVRSRRGQSSGLIGGTSLRGSCCAFDTCLQSVVGVFKRSAGITYCILRNGKHRNKENFQCLSARLQDEFLCSSFLVELLLCSF